MSMSKKDFIALADTIKAHNAVGCELDRPDETAFDDVQIKILADFCKGQNPNFNRDRWLGYIFGRNGKNGGKIE